MIEVRKFYEERARIERGMLLRGMAQDDLGLIDDIIAWDEERKRLQVALDGLNQQRNAASKTIGQLYKDGKRDEADVLKEDVKQVNDKISTLEEDKRRVDHDLLEALRELPNIPHEDVPPGASDAENELVQPWDGAMPSLPSDPLPHWELAKMYDILDFELGVKLSGSGFVVFKGDGARLQRALISFFLDRAGATGYTEYIPPLLVNEDSAMGTGHLPDKEGQMYQCERDKLFLIPTSELPLANLYRDVILTPDDLPIRLTSYTPCFRREAGSYGAHVKGLNRLHQFDKVEIVQVTSPATSYDALGDMVDHVKSILTDLELPYQIVRLCGGDLGFAATMTYDFEVYSAAQDKWLEVSSVSNCESFQANRLKLRIKEDKKKVLAHTLNGSALALPRIIAALLENNQTEEGIRIPAGLQPYMGGQTMIKRS